MFFIIQICAFQIKTKGNTLIQIPGKTSPQSDFEMESVPDPIYIAFKGKNNEYIGVKDNSIEMVPEKVPFMVERNDKGFLKIKFMDKCWEIRGNLVSLGDCLDNENQGFVFEGDCVQCEKHYDPFMKLPKVQRERLKRLKDLKKLKEKLKKEAEEKKEKQEKEMEKEKQKKEKQKKEKQKQKKEKQKKEKEEDKKDESSDDSDEDTTTGEDEKEDSDDESDNQEDSDNDEKTDDDDYESEEDEPPISDYPPDMNPYNSETYNPYELPYDTFNPYNPYNPFRPPNPYNPNDPFNPYAPYNPFSSNPYDPYTSKPYDPFFPNPYNPYTSKPYDPYTSKPYDPYKPNSIQQDTPDSSKKVTPNSSNSDTSIPKEDENPPKSDTSKGEQSKPEENKNPLKTDAPKVEPLTTESPNPDTSKPYAHKGEQSKPDEYKTSSLPKEETKNDSANDKDVRDKSPDNFGKEVSKRDTRKSPKINEPESNKDDKNKIPPDGPEISNLTVEKTERPSPKSKINKPEIINMSQTSNGASKPKHKAGENGSSEPSMPTAKSSIPHIRALSNTENKTVPPIENRTDSPQNGLTHMIPDKVTGIAVDSPILSKFTSIGIKNEPGVNGADLKTKNVFSEQPSKANKNANTSPDNKNANTSPDNKNAATPPVNELIDSGAEINPKPENTESKPEQPVNERKNISSEPEPQNLNGYLELHTQLKKDDPYYQKMVLAQQLKDVLPTSKEKIEKVFNDAKDYIAAKGNLPAAGEKKEIPGVSPNEKIIAGNKEPDKSIPENKIIEPVEKTKENPQMKNFGQPKREKLRQSNLKKPKQNEIPEQTPNNKNMEPATKKMNLKGEKKQPSRVKNKKNDQREGKTQNRQLDGTSNSEQPRKNSGIGGKNRGFEGESGSAIKRNSPEGNLGVKQVSQKKIQDPRIGKMPLKKQARSQPYEKINIPQQRSGKRRQGASRQGKQGGIKSGQSSGNQSGGDQSNGSQSSGGQSKGDQSNGGQSKGGQPSGSQTSGDQSNGSQSSGGQSNGGQSNGGQSKGGQPSGSQTSGDQSNGSQSSGGQSKGDQPSGIQSNGGQSSGVQSSAGNGTGRKQTGGSSSSKGNEILASDPNKQSGKSPSEPKNPNETALSGQKDIVEPEINNSQTTKPNQKQILNVQPTAKNPISELPNQPQISTGGENPPNKEPESRLARSQKTPQKSIKGNQEAKISAPKKPIAHISPGSKTKQPPGEPNTPEETDPYTISPARDEHSDIPLTGIKPTQLPTATEPTNKPPAATEPTNKPPAATNTTTKPPAATEPTNKPPTAANPTNKPSAATEPTNKPPIAAKSPTALEPTPKQSKPKKTPKQSNQVSPTQPGNNKSQIRPDSGKTTPGSIKQPRLPGNKKNKLRPNEQNASKGNPKRQRSAQPDATPELNKSGVKSLNPDIIKPGDMRLLPNNRLQDGKSDENSPTNAVSEIPSVEPTKPASPQPPESKPDSTSTNLPENKTKPASPQPPENKLDFTPSNLPENKTKPASPQPPESKTEGNTPSVNNNAENKNKSSIPVNSLQPSDNLKSPPVTPNVESKTPEPRPSSDKLQKSNDDSENAVNKLPQKRKRSHKKKPSGRKQSAGWKSKNPQNKKSLKNKKSH